MTLTLIWLPDLGRVLADGRGHALSMFPPDAGGLVSCTGACASTWPPLAAAGRRWPPLAVAAGATPRAGAGVNGHPLGTLADPNTGGRMVT